MANLGRVYVFWILIYICLLTEGSGYFISSTATTWQNASKECELVQPELKYNENGLVELEGQVDIQETIPAKDVWIGYFKALTRFQFKGCGWSLRRYPNITHTVFSLAQCHHICGETNMWIIVTHQIKTCVCTNDLYGLINDGCTLCDDIICGRGSYNAVYSVLTDVSVESRNSSNTDYLCQASTSSSIQSAWVMCADTHYQRKVWCRDKGKPYISTQTFVTWNAANDHCADTFDHPSSAEGYSGNSNTNLAFTNIRREWTLHTAKSSFNGPRMFAYITIGSTEIKFSNSSKEDRKHFLCAGTRPIATTTASSNQALSPEQNSTSEAPNEAFADSSRGPSTAATAAGVSVAVALAVAAVLIVVGLRKKGKLCFAITKGSTYENTDCNHHMSLATIDSKPNESYPESTQNGSFHGPVSNHTYCEHHTKTGTSKDLCTSTDTCVASQNTNRKLGLAASEVHSYFVLEANGNANSDPKNVLHANSVHANQGRRSTDEMPSNEANPYFVLEKQTTLNSTSMNTANTRDLANDDRDMYQEIDSSDTYAAIDDSRDDNNDYDYTNKAFKHSRMDFSDNVYNHLNTAGDDYDHVGKVHNKL
ncbi:uncharacterized protein LOC127832404 [Dreissena polymorpha]|uniref:Uncharacterized protein n=1 Tax=Dreissena polymorpha TaxID=45954 RepID=A0A9D4H6S5_DREPO|nr:uncharacterized protein LOC127832404 [Dreissena polymorpha]KAH3826352.1 hypothetical protein DPMN_128253 [Dreissena polymorpha]